MVCGSSTSCGIHYWPSSWICRSGHQKLIGFGPSVSQQGGWVYQIRRSLVTGLPSTSYASEPVADRIRLLQRLPIWTGQRPNGLPLFPSSRRRTTDPDDGVVAADSRRPNLVQTPSRSAPPKKGISILSPRTCDPGEADQHHLFKPVGSWVSCQLSRPMGIFYLNTGCREDSTSFARHVELR